MNIELSLNIPYLEASINNSAPLRFLLDTGSQMTVIDKEAAHRLGLETQGSAEGGGGGEGTIEVSFVNNITIKLADVSANVEIAAVAPLSSLLESHTGRRVHGVIGYDFISQYVIEIDYAAREINLYDPVGYSYSGKGEVIGLSIENNHPHIQAVVFHANNDGIEADFVVDTGASTGLSLSTPFVDHHGFITSGAATHEAFVAGAGGIAKTPVGRVDHLQVGSFVIDRLVTYFSQDKGGAFAGMLGADGVIGADFLRRFTVIFDYQNERMILESNRHFNEPSEGDACSLTGMSITAEGSDLKTFRIESIIEGSPAAEAGIKERDVVLAVNGTPAEKFDLEQLHRTFVKAKTFRLSIERGNARYETVINTTHPL